jgi:hypothetical protein
MMNSNLLKSFVKKLLPAVLFLILFFGQGSVSGAYPKHAVAHQIEQFEQRNNATRVVHSYHSSRPVLNAKLVRTELYKVNFEWVLRAFHQEYKAGIYKSNQLKNNANIHVLTMHSRNIAYPSEDAYPVV